MEDNEKEDEEDQSDTEEDNREYYVTIIDGVRYRGPFGHKCVQICLLDVTCWFH
jgi:hypothetical protein